MKLAFSTLGCPEWDLGQILTAAREWGYDGVEWRGYQVEMELPKAPIFKPAARAAALPGMAAFLRELGEIAAEHDVSIVLETHDAFSTGAQVAELLRETGHPAVGALWDLHHPYREGEPPETTVQLLGPYLRHT